MNVLKALRKRLPQSPKPVPPLPARPKSVIGVWTSLSDEERAFVTRSMQPSSDQKDR